MDDAMCARDITRAKPHAPQADATTGRMLNYSWMRDNGVPKKIRLAALCRRLARDCKNSRRLQRNKSVSRSRSRECGSMSAQRNDNALEDCGELRGTGDGVCMTMKYLLRGDCMPDATRTHIPARAASRMSASHLLLRRMKLGIKSGH
jgi:hypothetical protein